MQRYFGIECPVCNKPFTQSDDIVVCPVCGGPHHRECYADIGECAFKENHKEGKEWTNPRAGIKPPVPESGTAPAEAPREKAAGKICPMCGSENNPSGIFCTNCGHNFTQSPGPDARRQGMPGADAQWRFKGYGGFNPNSGFGGNEETYFTDRDIVNDKELTAFVVKGPRYYLRKFSQIEHDNKNISFNISAFFFHFMYYFYRKMYLVGIGFLFLYIFSIIPDFLYTLEMLPFIVDDIPFFKELLIQAGFKIAEASNANLARADVFLRMSNLATVLFWTLSSFVSIFANKLYYGKAKKTILDIKDRFGSDLSSLEKHNNYFFRISSAGGTSTLACFLALVICFVLTMVLSNTLLYFVMG